MRIIANDPYVNTQTAADLGVELVTLDALYAKSDYITLHMALTPETDGMLYDEAFAKMKTGVRIVNCARGELIDGEALQRGHAIGKVAGAALDVFQKEPPACRRSAARLGKPGGHAAHRRVHGRSAGDRGRPHRRAGGRISDRTASR